MIFLWSIKNNGVSIFNITFKIFYLILYTDNHYTNYGCSQCQHAKIYIEWFAKFKNALYSLILYLKFEAQKLITEKTIYMPNFRKVILHIAESPGLTETEFGQDSDIVSCKRVCIVFFYIIDNKMCSKTNLVCFRRI